MLRAARDGAESLRAGDIAGTPAAVIEPGATLAEAADVMLEQHVSHLVVADGGRPAGMLSTLDVAGTVAWGRA